MNVVVLSDVVKRYGRLAALDGLSLAVPRGAACAVIGPNGSGKTTMFAVVAGLLAISAGRVELFGEGPFDARRHAGRLGLMPQIEMLQRFVEQKHLRILRKHLRDARALAFASRQRRKLSRSERGKFHRAERCQCEASVLLRPA